MEVADAIRRAKVYAAEVLKDERISNLGLEEIDRDDDIWLITVGFSRPWDARGDLLSRVNGDSLKKERSYRVVKIRDVDGEVVSFKRHEGIPD